jgi:hypothetical protein
MSNFVSIATVTEAFRSLLEDAVDQSGVSGATATRVRPTPLTNMGQPGGLPSSGVNVYLYGIAPNAALRNADNPSRRGDGTAIHPTRMAYDLSYLLTFYGEENNYEPQMVLGSVLRGLNSEPLLSPERVKNAQQTVLVAYPGFPANLLVEVETVKLYLQPLGLEELSKLWSVFFQIPYSLSLAYQASVVFIDGREMAEPALPVHSRNVYVRTFRNPQIDAVLSQANLGAPLLPGQPIVKGDIVALSGRQLRGEVNVVRLGGMEIAPLDVSDTRVRFQLDEPPFPADTLRAGVHAVQVLQRLRMGTPETDHRGFESNAAALVLRPSISVSNTPVSSSTDVHGVTWYETDLTVQFTPKVALGQHVLLLLNEFDPPSNRQAYVYQYDLTPAPLPPGPPLPSLTTHVRISTPAKFLVRVQVDGAESALDLGPDPVHPLYTAPQVDIS